MEELASNKKGGRKGEKRGRKGDREEKGGKKRGQAPFKLLGIEKDDCPLFLSGRRLKCFPGSRAVGRRAERAETPCHPVPGLGSVRWNEMRLRTPVPNPSIVTHLGPRRQARRPPLSPGRGGAAAGRAPPSWA